MLDPIRFARFFPELARFPDELTRREAWHRASSFRVFTVVSELVLVMLIFVLAFTVSVPLAGFAAIGVWAVIGVPIRLLVTRRRIHRRLREKLVGLGIPTCMRCCYDLTGDTSGTCPECGSKIERDAGAQP